jgi:hypothetical protein
LDGGTNRDVAGGEFDIEEAELMLEDVELISVVLVVEDVELVQVEVVMF